MSKEEYRSRIPYVVYESDLKYKKRDGISQDLQYNNVIWANNDVKRKFYDENLDTVEYRFAECTKSKGAELDLNHMELGKFPTIPKEFYGTLKHLFMIDNNFTDIPDLSAFTKLETLDIGWNKLSKLPKLPPCLTELACKHNLLTEMTIPKNIKRLVCSYNNISKINIEANSQIEIIICDHNKLQTINNMHGIRKLCCNDNELTQLNNLGNNIIYLDCTNNKLVKLSDMPNLKDLICSKNLLVDLPKMNKVKYIEIYDTNITKIDYYDTLSELYCTNGQITKISPSYKIKEAKIHRDKLLSILFETTHKEKQL